MRKLVLPIVVAVILVPGAALAQLRTVALAFKPPVDSRVVGFHVYLAAASRAYADFRDDINFVPPVDASGVATWALAGIEEFSDVYVSLKSYDASGTESAFSNEVRVVAEVPPAAPPPVQHECEADADCAAPADACAGPRHCVAYTCQAGSALPDETACDDGNASTPYDVCRGGKCSGFACGSDAQCSDGQACDGAERCSGNVCVSGAALQCPLDSGPCYDSFCDLSAGCVVQLHPDGSSCVTSSSGSAGTCSAGVCQQTYSRKRWKHRDR
ncbi:MAG TPA: hypothetical protein VMR86_22610 [Myxococcota bacterium]|nr:hypothetical protein [Myxococcota bacterium]